MKITETALPGVLLLSPTVYRDDRGAFIETYNHRRMIEAGSADPLGAGQFLRFAQERTPRHSLPDHQAQGKLVRVTHGAALDVAVDLRRSSPQFGRHVAVELNGEAGTMLWIPVGFGHAFLALTEEVGFAYKVTDYYSQAGERTIAWNDPELAISWPVAAENLIISEKDRNGSSFRDAEVFA